MGGRQAAHFGQRELGDGSVQLQVLGPLRALQRIAPGEPLQPLDLGGQRPRRLLLALAVDAGEAVPLDRLTDRVWGEQQPADPKAALYTLVSRLRQVLGSSVISTDAFGYRLSACAAGGGAVAELDTMTFERLIATDQDATTGTTRRLEQLTEALSLWRGRAYDEVAGEGWARPTAERLEELRILTAEQRFDAILDLGDHVAALPELAEMVRAHPLRDRLVGQHMLALYRAGRTAEATRAFQEHRRRLVAELGLEPGPALAGLDRRIVSGDAALQHNPGGETAGRMLRGYRLGRCLAETPYVAVFVGTQPTLGRTVAVKVIRSQFANQPAFIRRFEAEAQRVAALEHPHIVPLYDYWREPDRAYLVFRFLRGGSLAARLAAAGPLPMDAVLRMVVQVGAALDAAHRTGVGHRDLRPSNVLLDDAENFYLGDFRLEIDGDPLATGDGRASTPRPSPVLQGFSEAVVRHDVQRLAETAHRALAGAGAPPTAKDAQLSRTSTTRTSAGVGHPRSRARVLNLLEGVMRGSGHAAADVPGFVAAFLRAAGLDEDQIGTGPRNTGAVPSSKRNPYKGLRPFQEADAADFRGRDGLVGRMVEALQRPGTDGHLVAVVGPSGCGKSSAVQAGLLPALRNGGVKGSERWFVATMVPGSDPFKELEAALLRIATAQSSAAISALEHNVSGLARAVRRLAESAGGGTVLLVIDQFEELFTLAGAENRRRDFLAALAHAVAEAQSALRVLVTLRADFYDHPLRYGPFARLIERGTIAVTPLAADELEAAIVEPALASGSVFEQGLVSQIIADVGDQAGALPLLQFALTALWEQRTGQLLTRAVYEENGGVAGSLARRAESLYSCSTPAEQACVRRLFGRLVDHGHLGNLTRRRVLRSELGADATAEVIDRFGRARLLSFDRDPVTREPTVDLAHEAMLAAWPRLRTWIDDDREDLTLLRHLSATSRAWEQSDRDQGELYRGGRLETAESWAAAHQDRLNSVERAFVHASIARRDLDRAATQRQVRRLRTALLSVAVVAIVAFTATVVAVNQRRRADAAAGAAETRRLMADAASIVGENRDLALLLASEAYRRAPGPQTLAGLQRVLIATGPYLGTLGAGEAYVGVAGLDDGTVVGLSERELHFFDGRTAQRRNVIALPAPAGARRNNRMMTTDGTTVVVGTEGGTVLVYDNGTTRLIPVGSAAVRSVALAGDVLVAGTADGMVHLLDLDSGRERWATYVSSSASIAEMVGRTVWEAIPAPIQDLYRNSEAELLDDGPAAVVIVNGRVVATTSFHLVALDAETGALSQRVAMPLSPFGVPWTHQLLAVLPDGRLLAGGTVHATVFDRDLNVVDARSIPTGRADINVVAVAAATAADGTPFWGLSDGRIVEGISDTPEETAAGGISGLGTVRAFARAADGSMLAAGDGGIVAWSTDGRMLLARAVPDADQTGATVAPDGALLSVGSLGTGTAVLYDLRHQLGPAVEPTGPVAGLMVTPDPLNRYLDSGSVQRLDLYDRTTHRQVGSLDDVGFLSFSFDGALLAAGRVGGNLVRVYDASTFEQVSPMLDLSVFYPPGRTFDVVVPGFSSNGDQLFVSLQDLAITVVYDTTTWQPSIVVGPDDHGGVVAARYNRDGGTLVTIGADGSIAIRDPVTWRYRRTLAGTIPADDPLDQGLYLSPTGDYLVTTRGGRPRLWHLSSGTLIGTFPHRDGLLAGGQDLGDQLQLVTLDNDRAYLWNLDVSSWPALACRAAGRNLSASEWEQFGPRDRTYRPTCPEWATAVHVKPTGRVSPDGS